VGAAQLKSTLNMIPAHTWYAAPSGALTFVNERIGDYLGLPKDHPLRSGTETGAAWDSHIALLHPDDRDAARSAWSSCLGTGAAGEVSFRLRNAQGGYRWFVSRAEPLRANDGTLLYWIGVNHDIEERKQAEFYLAEGQRLTHTGSWAFNAAGFEYWSAELFRIHGLEPGGQAPSIAQYMALVHPEDREFVAQEIQRMLAENRGFDFTKRIVRPDGAIRHVRCVGVPATNVGIFQGFVGTGIDVTEQEQLAKALRKSEEELRRAQRLEAMGTLAGGIAHDFNNILGAILGYGEAATRDARTGTRLRRDLDAIMAAGERGRALVDRILAFSRSGFGERAPIHVEEVVREALDQVAAKLPGNVTITPRLRTGRAAMLGDSTQVHQVVMNLANNAVQAMPRGGVLRVSLETQRIEAPRAALIGRISQGNYIVLKVTDAGTGIRAEVLERMFDPFFTTKEVGVGSGLGLSLVHGIVETVGGAIDVATELGKGSAFTVYLPRSGDAPVKAADENRPLPRGEGERVLVVDDEEALVRLATETLAGLGYTPVGFTSSVNALQEFCGNPGRFDAILTDQRMPGVTGSAIIREVRRIDASIPILLMSGFVSGAAALKARALGANAVLQKPLLARELATSLARALRRAASAPRWDRPSGRVVEDDAGGVAPS
jgi:PAS domain S-box-containing protein